ncbi:hypothetical protein CR513_34803, partial [Mucuna pruriens]
MIYNVTLIELISLVLKDLNTILFGGRILHIKSFVERWGLVCRKNEEKKMVTAYFWKDKWLINDSSKDLFPRLFSISSQKDCLRKIGGCGDMRLWAPIGYKLFLLYSNGMHSLAYSELEDRVFRSLCKGVAPSKFIFFGGWTYGEKIETFCDREAKEDKKELLVQVVELYKHLLSQPKFATDNRLTQIFQPNAFRPSGVATYVFLKPRET